MYKNVTDTDIKEIINYKLSEKPPTDYNKKKTFLY